MFHKVVLISIITSLLIKVVQYNVNLNRTVSSFKRLLLKLEEEFGRKGNRKAQLCPTYHIPFKSTNAMAPRGLIIIKQPNHKPLLFN